MKIVYDNIIFAYQKFGGISTVWYELVRRALRDRLDLWFVEFSPVSNDLRKKLQIAGDRVRKVPSGLRIAFKYLRVVYRSREPFIFHSSYYRVCLSPKAVNITTVHDFTNEKFQRGPAALKERLIKHMAIRGSDYVICISENTRRDFSKYFPTFPQERVKVIYNGVSDEFHPLSSDERGTLPYQERSYILFVGARNGYKRFDLVASAMGRMDMNLVLTGDCPDELESQMLMGYETRVHYAGRVDAATLNKLYNGAYALVYPSEYEGFGLPVLEAQRAGCPVVAYNGSSIPEIIGDTPLLMDTLSADELLSKLNLLRDDALREAVVNAGLVNASRFSWERMYEEVLELYDEAFAGRQTSLRG